MLASSLRLLLVLAHLAASALPCPVSDPLPLAPGALGAYASGALHSHGAPPTRADGELRAPCLCGCDEAPVGHVASSPLGAALPPAPIALRLPSAAPPPPGEALLAERPQSAPAPVPRSA